MALWLKHLETRNNKHSGSFFCCGELPELQVKQLLLQTTADNCRKLCGIHVHGSGVVWPVA